VRPGGEVVFSTINRNPKAYLLAVIGAEYVLGLLPRGTHDYEKFIRPSELAGWSRNAGLTLEELRGLSYNPLTRHYRLGADLDVNYLARLRRSAAAGD
jgi:2-polyprenyl-6-hydroxyphenyl methylase/3-demethylubiquinone-9 3-methyltransferase